MPKKILLADDSLTIQKVVELTFSDSDYELICVSNGERALERVRDDRPDLILADVVMPEKNGYEVCEAIKGNPATSRIPVVLLSGTFEPFDRPRAERIGADAIVSKPFDSQQLLAQVDALLARTPTAAAPATPSPIPQTTAAIAIPPPAPPPSAPAHSDDPPFDVGFSAEDFTAAVRLPPTRTGIDPFEEEYGRGDVDSAIEAFEKAHPRFGFGSDLEPDVALASQPLDRSKRLESEESGTGADEPAQRGEEPFRRDDASPRDPQWLGDEPEKVPSAAIRDTPPRPLDFDREDPIADEAATIAIQRSQMPTIPDIRADELPTVEFPTVGYGREVAPVDDRRSPLETADASLGAGESFREPAPFEMPEPVAPAAASPGSGSPREITATDAHLLFDVVPPADEPEIHEPHPMPSAFGEPAGAEPDFGSAMEPHPLEASDFGAVGSEAAGQEAVRDLDSIRAEAASVSREPLGAATEAEHETPSAAVPGDIEMLAQRSSIPELTRMLSSMRSTGDITDEQLDRLAAKVVEKLSDKIVREIAWEVIPDMAEIVIRQRIKELEAGAE